MGCDTPADPRVARLIDANLDRAREGLRVVEDWCRFGLERDDLVKTLKDWRQRLGALHADSYKQARSTATDRGAGLGHPAQLDRRSPRAVVAANCGRVQEALRVLEEYARSSDPTLASEAAVIRYGLYDLEVTCLNASDGLQRRNRLKGCTLCLITSPTDKLLLQVSAALRSGVSMVQYRCKHGDDRERLKEAIAVRDLCRTHGALFIVNDRVDLAMAADADGVHLGQDDIPVDVARSLIGADRLLGLSTHSLREVQGAMEEPVDYIGLGPVFSTAVKPDRAATGTALIEQAMTCTPMPLFAIGGINSSNLSELTAIGCRRIAVIGAIMSASDPSAASLQLLESLSSPRD
ncbi:hypothetical protein KR100_11585 [Synechococcus sp. KORDI-100]|uniref:thiamine phosphate synthase n=1 Tax=Synechococcus sp. KORDI-100 TaxID=1280380 RepID=UPI0004E081A5|nr:thiamine phosphate synthase [Synechococcus sp. KORDI-100]AII43997.1 hypothetical protein KR100_11585 [Synechococcus sp. KORDI-100]